MGRSNTTATEHPLLDDGIPRASPSHILASSTFPPDTRHNAVKGARGLRWPNRGFLCTQHPAESAHKRMLPRGITQMNTVSSGDYSFEARMDGQYIYCFSNEHWSANSKEVSFNVHGIVYVPESEAPQDPL